MAVSCNAVRLARRISVSSFLTSSSSSTRSAAIQANAAASVITTNVTLLTRNRWKRQQYAAVNSQSQRKQSGSDDASLWLALAAAAACAAAAAQGDGKQVAAEYHPPKLDKTESYFDGEYDFIKVFAGTSNAPLANEIAHTLGVGPAKWQLGRYADGEVSLVLNEHVRGKDVYIVQSGSSPVSDSVVELLLAVSTMQRASAKRVTAVIPYYAYKFHRRGVAHNTHLNSRFLWSPAADIGTMLEVMGVDRVIAVDLERPGNAGESNYFGPGVPVETLLTTEMFADIFGKEVFPPGYTKPIMVVSPSAALLKKAVKFKLHLEEVYNLSCSVTTFSHGKSTSGPVNIAHNELICNKDEIKGKDVVIVDELIDTGDTLVTLSRMLKKMGCADIYVYSSHALFNANAIELINKSPIKKVYVTNSVMLPVGKGDTSKIEQVSIGPHLARMIYAEHVRSAEVFQEDVEIA